MYRWHWDLVVVLLAVIIGLLNFWVDGMFGRPMPGADETRYFLFGQALWLGHLQAWDWSPLMALIYAPFAYPGANQDLAYHLSRLLLGPLNVVLAYRLGRTALDRWGAGGLALLVALNAPFLTDYAAHLAGMTVSLLALTAFLRGRAGRAFAILFIGALLRPEFAFVAVFGILIEWIRPKTFSARVSEWAWAAILLGLYILCFPDKSDFSRTSEAFIQHYAWSASERGIWSGQVWSEYGKVAIRDFGAVQLPLWGYFKANPQAFLRHVLHNVAIFPRSLSEAMSIKAFTDTPSRFIGPVLLMFGPCALRALGWLEPLRGDLDRLFARVKWGGLLLLAAVPIWLLIRPRPSYLHMATPYVWLFIILSFERALSTFKRHRLEPQPRLFTGKADS